MNAFSINELEYWRSRAEHMGRRAVFDSRHSDDELSAVTSMQKREIYPVLKGLLKPWHRMLVDFGCGYGRFSGDLADLIEGNVLALDPVSELLRLAPAHARVEYRNLDSSGKVPVGAGMVDVVWCCLVLGTIHQEDAFRRTTDELTRILKTGGICFIVENISVNEKSFEPYKKRSVTEIMDAFPKISLTLLHHYTDIDETIGVFGGTARGT